MPKSPEEINIIIDINISINLDLCISIVDTIVDLLQDKHNYTYSTGEFGDTTKLTFVLGDT